MTSAILLATLGIQGMYFEARNCSLFAGPCHFSGEVMMDGNTALLAWDIKSGTFEGISLAGKKGAAVIHASKNFVFDSPRRSILFLQNDTTAAQRDAFIALIRTKVDLGTIVAISTADVRLEPEKVTVATGGSTAFSALLSERPCTSCTMPGQLWYEPLTDGVSVRVTTVEEQQLKDCRLGESWLRRNEQAAFVGTFQW